MRRTRTKETTSDEYYTLREDVTPLLNLVDKDKVIWLPFDTEQSEYYKVFKENGYNVIISHKDNGKDFFEWEPDYYDIAISNIPFSEKIKIFNKQIERDKPFIFLAPSNSFSLKSIKMNAKDMNFIWKEKRHKFIHKGEIATPAECVYVCYKSIKHNMVFE